MWNRSYAAAQGILALSLAVVCWADLDVRGPYLGQPSPGLEARVFAPEIISTTGNTDGRLSWSPDGLELYYVSSIGWTYTQGREGLWTEPRHFAASEGIPPVFTAVGLGFMGPALSGDGQRAYAIADGAIWMSEQVETGWSAPRNLGIPEHNLELWWLSVTNDGTLYMTLGNDATDAWYIYRTKPNESGAYPALENITNAIGAGQVFYHHISPDGSVFILSQWNAPGGYGGHDLYVSFRDEQDRWTRPRNLGSKINTAGAEWSPFLTADGKYLFFNHQTVAYGSPIDVRWIETRAVLPDPNGTIENQTNGQRFNCVQCAIDYAAAGDTLVVEPGIYRENVTLDRDIILTSVEPNDSYYVGGTIMQGSSDTPALDLTGTSANCKIAGLTVRTGSVGVLGAPTQATLRNCRIMDNVSHGLELSRQSAPRLEHCLIAGNGEHGIMMHPEVGRFALHCRPTIEDCVIAQNGGESLEGGEPVLVHTITAE